MNIIMEGLHDETAQDDSFNSWVHTVLLNLKIRSKTYSSMISLLISAV